MFRPWPLLILLGVTLTSGQSTARPGVGDAEPTENQLVQRIPFELRHGFAVIVRGSIGNAKNLKFLIDTGASPSVVDRRVAQKLHLTLSTGRFSTFTRRVDVDQAIASDLHLGPFHADELRVLVHDLSGLEETLGVRVDAMVGYDFLQQGAFTIDYASRSVLFGPIDPQLETIPYASGLSYVVVLMRVQDAELPLLVDTGAHDLIVFEDGLEDSIKTTASAKAGQTFTNLGGEIKVKPLDFSRSFLGAMPWSDRGAFLLQDSHTTYSAGFKGLLGVAALQSARVGFDPVRRLFAWESKITRFASAADLRQLEISPPGGSVLSTGKSH
ncbi:MAG: aspartyl protease family protein [Terriglobales bacterium]